MQRVRQVSSRGSWSLSAFARPFVFASASAVLAFAACDDASDQENGGANDAGSRNDAGAKPDAGDSLCTGAGDGRRTFYWDGDGDGYGVVDQRMIRICAVEPPAGYAARGIDCDDSDATKQTRRYRDADGDGYGDETSQACVSASDSMYVSRGGDCDDSDATRNPGVLEVWRDGIDQDCDGLDEPRGCIAAPGKDAQDYAEHKVTPFPDFGGFSIEPTPQCAAADLHFVLLGACSVCGGGKSTLVVGNSGETGAAFEVVSNADKETVSTPLDPLSWSAPIELELYQPGSRVEIRLLAGGVDCDPTNNVRELEFVTTDCF